MDWQKFLSKKLENKKKTQPESRVLNKIYLFAYFFYSQKSLLS